MREAIYNIDGERLRKLIFKYYMENSILVRDFTTHPVLTGCLRITVGLPEENEQLISKLQALCAEVKA